MRILVSRCSCRRDPELRPRLMLTGRAFGSLGEREQPATSPSRTACGTSLPRPNRRTWREAPRCVAPLLPCCGSGQAVVSSPSGSGARLAAPSESESLDSSSARNGLNSPSSPSLPAIVAARARPAASSVGRTPPSSRNGLYSEPPSSSASPARASRAARRSRSLRAATFAGAPVPAGMSLPMMTFSLRPIR
jgi:hypothetical protein